MEADARPGSWSLRSWTLRWCVALAGVAALAVAGIAAGAVTPGQAFDSSPSQGAPFTVVAFSGTDCAGSSPEVLVELETTTGDDVPGGTGAIPGASVLVFLTPDGSGAWSGNITIPPVIAPGAYRLVAVCRPDPSTQVAYAPQPFEVLPGPLASMSATPSEGVAGTDLVLTVSGTLCRGEGAAVDVRVFLAADEGVGTNAFAAQARFLPDADGNWAGMLSVPGTAIAGDYSVVGECSVNGQQFFLYLPPPRLLLVGPPPPVILRPTFTG
jgi:hypothetical protein